MPTTWTPLTPEQAAKLPVDERERVLAAIEKRERKAEAKARETSNWHHARAVGKEA